MTAPLPERKNVRIHATADVSDKAQIGEGSSIWNQAQVRENTKIGRGCIIGKNAYIDFEVVMGDHCKVQNNSSIYHGANLENGVFVGPHCVITNDLYPRAINPDGSLKGAADWTVSKTHIGQGAALGAQTVVVCGVKIGAWAMTGSGSVVTHDIPPHGLVRGNPARLKGFVCYCGHKLELDEKGKTARAASMTCTGCQKTLEIPIQDYELMR